MTRQAKTPRQHAEETLAVAQRRVDQLTKHKARLQGQLNQLVSALEEAQARLDYVKHDPALTNPTTPGGTTA